MQIFKVICVAVLCVAAIAHPMDDDHGNGNGNGNGDNTTDALPKLEWWENGVFYQIYPRSFRDSNGDGIGDIRGIIEKLDYLQDLGIDGAWLSPIFKSPMKDFGYDISDFCDIEPMFGTVADVEELFKEAAKRNIKIILDFVPNHTSDKHKWFVASSDPSHAEHQKYRDYYVWSDGKNNKKNPPNNWVSTFYGAAWTFHEKRQQWYYHNFVKEQPDLNYRNPDVVNEMIGVFNFWLSKGASGFRIDAINHMFECEDLRDEPLSGKTNDPKAYEYTLKHCTADQPEMYEMVYKFRKVADEYQKDHGGDRRLLMTEAYTNETEYVKYFKSADGKKLGSQMPFNFILIKDLDRHSSVAEFKSLIDVKINNLPSNCHLNWVIGNHDRPRVGSRYGERRIAGLQTLVMTLPGIAVTYMGEEIGMLDHRTISYGDTLDPAACNLDIRGNWLEESRDPERTPFQWDASKFAGFMPENASKKPWLPIHPNAKELNVAAQKDQPRSTLNFYKQLLQLRKEDTFAYGSFVSNVFNDNVFAYVRALNKSATYVVLINFGEREEKIDISTLAEHLPDKLELAAVGTDSCYVHGENVTAKELVLRKYDTLILKAPHAHHTGAGSSVIASIALTFALMFASIARFIF